VGGGGSNSSSSSKPSAGAAQKLAVGVKVVILGESSTGKTSLVLRLIKNIFEAGKAEPTIGAAFMVHNMSVDGRPAKLEIWDTAGQERFQSLAPMYYRGAAAAVIVYDITKRDTFERTKKWVLELRDRAPPGIVIAIAGNKLDLEAQRAVTAADAAEQLQQIESETGETGQRMLFIECSAKTGDGVQQLFTNVCKKLLELTV
jgi:small GTP-binding protein